ncbi:sodium:alanine symporter family protein [uncultured Muribaculum sp.]|uniref:alanine/glycine:cation symporter family protein n=1 Tax=uncultured Muribaculum sp. TaxID=1918613 RepID=UPI0025F2CBF6|nr:alanine/glycine:cation symporter family protein [uncultured Muribaculum sp.]
MNIINAINDFLWSYLLIAILLGAGLYFTLKLRGVQFRLIGEMARLLVRSGERCDDTQSGQQSKKRISSFQAFAISLASRVGTGNIAGVGIAIAIGGPGAVFWMWVVALLSSANAFVESTLAQLFKEKGKDSYCGGPAYYIQKGTGRRWWAVTFAILITLTFAFAFNSVQSNTISLALHSSFGLSRVWIGVILTALTLAVIFGGIRRIARINEVLVPVMAILYIMLALYVIAMRIGYFPHVMKLIFENAFGINQAAGGSLGMAMIMGVKRGLFSNEAGEGSTPNAAATAAVSHPAKQGLIQTLGVYVDTLLVCTATAFIILCSGMFDSGLTGIELTQAALSDEVGVIATVFVAAAIMLFGFTSIIANYYYGENNLDFIHRSSRLRIGLRIASAAMVMAGTVASLDLVWAIADITMALMTLCNIIAILVLGRYAAICLNDYMKQRRQGKDPVYRKETIPEIADRTECW